MEYHRHLSNYSDSVWAIRPERLESLLAMSRGVHSTLTLNDELVASIEAARGGARPRGGDIARIRIEGVIEPKTTLWSLLFGGAGLDMIAAEFDAALKDPDIKGILLDIDSPGGVVSGVPEMAKTIRAARGQKPILAVANAQMASAAYYLASQADSISSTPSGDVGSIGVVYMHTDARGFAEQMGVSHRIFRSQERKADVNPWEELSEAAAADIQSKVDAYDEMFVADVAKGRGVSQSTVRANYGSGRMFLAEDAKAAGLIDQVETIDEAAARLSSGRVAIRPAAERAEEQARQVVEAIVPTAEQLEEQESRAVEQRARANRIALWKIQNQVREAAHNGR